MTVADRVVLITGASDGIGAACVRVFRGLGARVALTGRSETKLARVAAVNELAIAADLTEPGVPEKLVARTIQHYGGLDILINNAGEGVYRPIAASGDAETRRMFEINFFAPLALIRAALPAMHSRGCGMVVNVGSIAGKVSLPWMPLYSTSKAALGALTGSLATELDGTGVRAMLVCPGYVLTEFQNHAPFAAPAGVVTQKRFAISPETCARAIARGIERNRRVILTPAWCWGLIAVYKLMPRLVERRLMQMRQSEGHL